MKTYTTETVEITVAGAAEALAGAERVIVAARGTRRTVEKPGAVDGETVAVSFTQAETAALGAGRVDFEVTVKLAGGDVVKTDTVSATLEEAVLRREV